MLVWAHPWLFLALPLPLLVMFFLPPFVPSESVLRAPLGRQLEQATGRSDKGLLTGSPAPPKPWGQRVVYGLVWLCLVAAMARPQWLEEPIIQNQPKRDLMLAVDLSGSMSIEDFSTTQGEQINRLAAVKQVLGQFLAGRESERVGLIVFGSSAFVQMPFSDDLSAVASLLDETEVGMAGPRTMLGDAIGLAIGVFDRSELDQHLMILVTDGNDTGSLVPPQRAAEMAAERGIVIYTVGVGDPAAAGEAPLDEAALTALSEVTGGTYFHAGDQAQLEGIYAQLDRLNPVLVDSVSYRPKRDLFFWPLVPAVILPLLFHGLAAGAVAANRRKTGKPSAAQPDSAKA